MKVTVAHLYKKLEELDRDVVELKKLTDRLATDREYSPILKETFLSEMTKLEDQKTEILGLRVEKQGHTLKSVKSNSSEPQVTRENQTPKQEWKSPPTTEPKKPERPVRKY
ncbi:hypothetical protein [Leptospira bouyouniensis]|uniref:Uncharacterized protein n=1 Tax=Leptospira bouyouniensis TaxID=2484911 RepID=A0ABY2L2X8_9LEPT|nr:hypothetical protein [Leptospira bouyouniensis]TGK48289.1 hypothetical protein EHQ10_11215 [Leptospira bouyouniensis]